MHDALAMSMINCVCDHYEHPKDFWKVWAVSLNQLIKATALAVAAYEKGLWRFKAMIHDLKYVMVVEFEQRLDLAPKARESFEVL
jgi:hypothetical protein